MPKISVILTTYERPQALACCLEKFRHQTFEDFEIVLGDDGSGDETRAVVEKYKKVLPCELIHVWTEHQDHGRTRVINNSIRQANGEYYVFSDGDCIPEPDFLETHWNEKRPGYFLCGRRLMLPDEDEWRDITPEEVATDKHRDGDVSSSWKDIKKRERKAMFYRLFGDRKWHRLRLLGANFSMWAVDFEAINGFDEGYVGWGAADEDFRRRLHRMGIRWKSVMSKALMWHIPHPPIASKPKKVKQGRNASRYDAWCYLTRPVLGLEHRGTDDLRIWFEKGSRSAKYRRASPSVETSRGERSSAFDVKLIALGLDGESSSRYNVDGWSSFSGEVTLAIIPPGASGDLAQKQLAHSRHIDAIIGQCDGEKLPSLKSSLLTDRIDRSDIPAALNNESLVDYYQRKEAELRETVRQALA